MNISTYSIALTEISDLVYQISVGGQKVSLTMAQIIELQRVLSALAVLKPTPKLLVGGAQ